MSYTSKGSALVILLDYNSSAVESDIPDYFVTAADDEINFRTDSQWEADSVDQTQLLDGRGVASIFSKIVPIVSLTEVVIIDDDESETSLDLSGSDREIRYNAETGEIFRITSSVTNLIERDVEDDRGGLTFPDGVANVRVVGKFGRTQASDLLRFIANMIILRMMSRKQPSKYAVAGKISERIGKYQYNLGAGSGSGENQGLTLDGYINYLFNILPKQDSVWIEAV